MGRWEEERSYHEEGPDGVVEEDDGGGHQHGEADELVELLREEQLVLFSFLEFCVANRIASKIEWWPWRRRRSRARK